MTYVVCLVFRTCPMRICVCVCSWRTFERSECDSPTHTHIQSYFDFYVKYILPLNVYGISRCVSIFCMASYFLIYFSFSAVPFLLKKFVFIRLCFWQLKNIRLCMWEYTKKMRHFRQRTSKCMVCACGCWCFLCVFVCIPKWYQFLLLFNIIAVYVLLPLNVHCTMYT